MLYAGMDIHLTDISVGVLGENGEQVRRARVPDASALVKLLMSLEQPPSVCYEASCGYGPWHEMEYVDISVERSNDAVSSRHG